MFKNPWGTSLAFCALAAIFHSAPAHSLYRASTPALGITQYLPVGYVRDGSVDYSAEFRKALNETVALGMELYIPYGLTVAVANIPLPSGSVINIAGTVRLTAQSPHGSVIFRNADQIRGNNRIKIYGTGTLDGNKLKQGPLTCVSDSNPSTRDCGHGLVDIRNSSDIQFSVAKVMGNYFPNSYPTAETTASVYFQNSTRVTLKDSVATDYGREAFQLADCTNSFVSRIKAFGGVDSWSALQISGSENFVDGVISSNAGASGISIDTSNSKVMRLYTYNNRFFHGINFGHAGKPASGTIATDLGSFGAPQNGINVGFGTTGLTISRFHTDSSRGNGINISNLADNIVLQEGCLKNYAGYGLKLYRTHVKASSVYFYPVGVRPVFKDATSVLELTTAPTCTVSMPPQP